MRKFCYPNIHCFYFLRILNNKASMTCRNHSTLTSHWSSPISQTSVAKSAANPFFFQPGCANNSLVFLKGILSLLKEQEKEAPELGSYLIAGKDLNAGTWTSFYAYNAVSFIIIPLSWVVAGTNICSRVVIDTMMVSINTMALVVVNVLALTTQY